MTPPPRTIPVSLPPSPPRAYDILVGEHILPELGPRAAALTPGRRAFLVTDANLPRPLVESARESLYTAGFDVRAASVTPSEANKTLDTVSRLLHALAHGKHERRDPVIALGGGIVGDLAGFAAAVYRRGVPVIQCPTTLLSMVDASVGGKTGANLSVTDAAHPDASALRKNLVGSFWQPVLVLADIAALESLSERQFNSGLAECLKHGLISADSDPALFKWTNDNLLRLRMGDAALRAELVERNVRVKARIVEGDEREEKTSALPPGGAVEGGRALLNLGHTFAHAIETIEHLSPDGDPANAPLQHGEAVALGLVAAAETSHALGMLSAADTRAVRISVERLGLESRILGLPPDDQILASMSHDKKVEGGRLRLVLLESLGRAKVVEDPDLEAVRAGIGGIRG